MIGFAGLIGRAPGQGLREHATTALGLSGRDDLAIRSTDGSWVFVPPLHARNSGPLRDAPAQPLAAMLGTAIPRNAAGDVASPDGQAVDVRAVYAVAGRAVGERLAGAFCACVLDTARQTLLLINDVVGTFPMYWQTSAGRFAFGPSVASVSALIGQRSSLDLRAAADYLHYGLLFEERTLARDVHLVPAGTTLVFDWSTGTVTFLRHDRPDRLFTQVEQTHEDYLERVRVEFNGAVARACLEEPVGLSLSGGLDSRAILSAIGPRATPLRTYTVGVRYCADHVISAELSALKNTTHTFLELSDAYLSNFLPSLERMISLTDGMYLSHGLTEILALEAVKQAGIKSLLRGHCGELAKANLAWPFHVDDQIAAMRTREEFLPYFFARVNYVSRSVKVEDVFHPDLAGQVSTGARESLESTLTGITLPPADLCSYLYLTQHHRRFTIPSIQLFRHEAAVTMPFADDQFLAALLSGPAVWRRDTAIHRHITGRNNGRLLRVRNSNTGAPGSAGPLVEKLIDPINSLLKRLNVKGYRHYHRFDVWMREQLLSSVEDILFDGTTTRRGLFRPATLRRLADETRTGAADHGYLLQVLLVLELWQRQHERAS